MIVASCVLAAAPGHNHAVIGVALTMLGLESSCAKPVTADADAEGEAPPAEQVQGHALAGDLGGATAGQGHHHGAKAHLLGVSGDGGQRDPWITHLAHRRPPSEVAPHEHAVPAGLLRLGRHADDRPRVGELVEQRQPQSGLHDAVRA